MPRPVDIVVYLTEMRKSGNEHRQRWRRAEVWGCLTVEASASMHIVNVVDFMIDDCDLSSVSVCVVTKGRAWSSRKSAGGRRPVLVRSD